MEPGVDLTPRDLAKHLGKCALALAIGFGAALTIFVIVLSSLTR